MKGTTKKLFRNISSVALAVITGLSFLPSAFVSAEDAGSNVEPVISTVEETDAAIDSMDFSSKRLMVFSSNPEVQTALMNSNGYISSYSQMFLLQFETENEAKSAYRQFVPIADVVEIDTGIQIADDVVAAEEVSTDTVMTVEDNPIKELQELVQEGSASYDIALIDTGASVDSNVASSVSVIGEDASDHHGHGTEMKGYMVEQNPNAANKNLFDQ